MSEETYITTAEAQVLLKCAKVKFYRIYYPRLTLYKDEGNYRSFFLKSEVEKLKETVSQEREKRIKTIRPKKVRDAIK